LDSAGWIWLVIVALLLSGTYLLLSSPARCDWWIEKLDVRNWSAAMWTGVSLAFAFVALCGWLAAVQNAKPEEDFISKWKLRAVGLNVLLGLAAVGLPAQMCWPAIDAWQNRPRPGMQVAQQYLTKGDDNTGTAEVRYLLYLPEGYGESRRWPLVVFLHGEEGGGENLELVRQTGLPKLIERHSGVVSYGVKPSQALPNGQPSSGGPTKFTGLRNSFVLLSPQCPADSQWTPQLVLELIEHICSSLSIDRERVYVTGYRMGGSGAWEVASQDPGRFAALVSVCGGRAGDVERLKNVSVWLFEEQKNAGANWESSETVEALRAGGGEVQFTACPAGPATCDSVYRTRELYEWLFAQKRHQ
jgi:poly(3-hydroxybutyrate) depolymerase